MLVKPRVKALSVPPVTAVIPDPVIVIVASLTTLSEPAPVPIRFQAT